MTKESHGGNLMKLFLMVSVKRRKHINLCTTTARAQDGELA